MVEHATDQWWNDDDLLLAALDRAMHPTVDVSTSFVQAAHSCYALRDLDAELAALAYDSEVDTAQLAAVRGAESATLRALTFEATDLMFELEVMPDGLAGQLIPPQSDTLQLVPTSGESIDVHTDRNGYFRIRPAPVGSFRLRCRLSNGRVVSTALITL
jgi:hypothetical protein